MNGSDVTQLMLVDQVTTWRIGYVQLTFIPHTFILYRTCDCIIITYSKKYLLKRACDFRCSPEMYGSDKGTGLGNTGVVDLQGKSICTVDTGKRSIVLTFISTCGIEN